MTAPQLTDPQDQTQGQARAFNFPKEAGPTGGAEGVGEGGVINAPMEVE